MASRRIPARPLNITTQLSTSSSPPSNDETGTASAPIIVDAAAERNPFLQWLQGIFGTQTTTTEHPPAPDVQTPVDCEPCECGVINKKNRIVGGHETEINQYPWMALLLYSGRFYCGATLINDRYVLTAAHCVNGFNMERITVRLLEHDRSTATETKTLQRNVQRIIKHAAYNSATYNNDIALLRLDVPLEPASTGVRPVCLPTAGKSFTGTDGIVTGWGATQEHGSIATNLQEVQVPIMSNRQCRTTGYGSSRITDNMLCAGLADGGRDSCQVSVSHCMDSNRSVNVFCLFECLQGDSGGPLHVNNGTHQIVGVVSWGEGCAKPNYPGVYTRVNRYGTWIRSNTRDACYC